MIEAKLKNGMKIGGSGSGKTRSFKKPDLMAALREAILCPNCKEPLTCTLFTHVLIQKSEVPLTRNGIEIVSDDEETAAPVMYADDFCMLLGHYGKVEERQGTFFQEIKKITCRNCGDIKYCLVREEDDTAYSLIMGDKNISIKNKVRRKKK